MNLTENRWLTGHGFGVHSPWAYDLIEFVINEKLPYYAYEDLYPFWEKAPQYLPQYPQSRDELLFRLVNRFNPGFILEIGTGAGVSTGYLASVSKDSKVVTVDHTHPAVKEVRKNLKRIPNIEYIVADDVLETVQEILDGGVMPKFVHVAHTSQWRQVVELLIPRMESDAVIVVEDLGKKEKKEWWKGVIQNEKVGVTFQMSKVGLLFFDLKKTKQHYLL
ncbi:MAG: class I SAM-dependent methyltransferase [Bacteroidetes bacterium]|nr:class I SAM-dependent methyltransferase [Candidatus Colenecus caballi]